MKKLILFALLLCAGKVFAQNDTTGLNIPVVDNAVIYERVYNMPAIPKDRLYGNAQVWFAGTHPDGGKTLLPLRDSVLSRVAGRANYAIVVPYTYLWAKTSLTFVYNFTVQVDCKDNKYRVRINNIQYGEANTPIEEMVGALSQSKSLSLASGFNLSKRELRQRLGVFSNVIDNLLVDLRKKMADNSDF